ncbi:MAG: cyclic nucleotide-binding domain-containing protein [Carboxydocellales bacterium]
MAAYKVHFLAKVAILSELNDQELTELAEYFQWEEYAQGTEIIQQGQERHWFYVLTEGRAEATVNKKGLETMPAITFSPGDTFGEIALFTGQPSPKTILCVENCIVLAMDAEHFARMLIRWPILYKKFIETLSNRLNQVNTGLWEAKHKDFLRAGLQISQYEQKFYGIWGSAKTTKEVENKLTELAQEEGHLLLIGERGTGRQMMAWFLHKRKFGEAAPFVVVDGRHLDQQWGDLMFETHDHDTPSSPMNRGLLDIAEHGTLFIREINLISPRAQLRLAKSLQCRECKCFIIGSINDDPEQLTQRLIPELKACFNLTYKITPLRERKRDIAVIAQGVLEKLALQNNRKTPTLDQEATKLLLSHNYRQGNVTELLQVIERAFYLAEYDVIGLEHVFFGPTAEKLGWSIDLLSWQWVEKLIKKGTFILWLQRICALIFLSIIAIPLVAPSTTLSYLVFTAVWGLWWPALAIISPFLGRVWCTVCPFSYLMDLVQKVFHLNRPVPDFLKKYDYLIITFLFLFIFWIEAVTGMRYNPQLTVVLLASILLSAIISGIIFTRHTWCHHICPLGGFVGTASIGGMLEVRSDATVCLNKCTTYECYKGHGDVPGCPMSMHAPYVDNNLACKMCFNCVRNCPNGAVKFNLRVPAREVWHLVRVNQGYAIFIGVLLMMLLPINYFEPLHQTLSPQKWNLWFTIVYWGSALLAGGMAWLIAKPFKTKAASQRIKLIFAAIPLVLGGYIFYQIHFLPGIGSLMFGVGLKTSAANTQAYYIPALMVGQALAILIGVALSGFSAVMVLVGAKEKSVSKSAKLEQLLPVGKGGSVEQGK